MTRGQRQPAAGDEIEQTRLAPYFHHHGAERIAGQRIGCRPQRALRIGHVDHHQKTRIKTEFAPSAHRQRAGFACGKILPHPKQRPVRAHPLRKTCDESGRSRAVPSLREHLMHGAAREPALQHRIHLPVIERRPVRYPSAMTGLEPRDAVTQARKLLRAASGSRHDQKSVRDIRTDDKP